MKRGELRLHLAPRDLGVDHEGLHVRTRVQELMDALEDALDRLPREGRRLRCCHVLACTVTLRPPCGDTGDHGLRLVGMSPSVRRPGPHGIRSGIRFRTLTGHEAARRRPREEADVMPSQNCCEKRRPPRPGQDVRRTPGAGARTAAPGQRTRRQQPGASCRGGRTVRCGPCTYPTGTSGSLLVWPFCTPLASSPSSAGSADPSRRCDSGRVSNCWRRPPCCSSSAACSGASPFADTWFRLVATGFAVLTAGCAARGVRGLRARRSTTSRPVRQKPSACAPAAVAGVSLQEESPA